MLVIAIPLSLNAMLNLSTTNAIYDISINYSKR